MYLPPVISDTIDAVATTLESGILSVVENLENAKTKFFSINGGDLSETRTIQLSNLPDGISVYIDGKLTLKEAFNQAIIKTRQYIKRQMTWFRGQMTHWKDFDDIKNLKLRKKVLNFIRTS